MRTYTTTISKHGGFNINSNLWQQEAIAAVNSNYHNMKITKDNFVWLIVTEKAKEIYISGLFELHILHDDDSDSLIEGFGQLTEAIEDGQDIGIEVGFIKPRTNENKLR
jgi:hypothetical protein